MHSALRLLLQRQAGVAAALVSACFGAWAGTAAEVTFVAGKVQAGTPARALRAGDAVQEGERLITGPDGYLYLRTADRGFLILRPNTEAQITQYQYDPARPTETRAKIELLRGVARAVSGQGVQQAKEHFRFNTPVAAIGIRGTDFSVYTDSAISRATVRSGAIAMSGFGGDCAPSGSGPCSGAVELSAHTPDAILQIHSGQTRPEQLDVRSRSLAPDRIAPPMVDELVGKGSGHPTTDRGPQAGQLPTPESAPAPTPTPPVVVTPPPTPDPTLPADAPRLVNWGRWTAVANLPANTKVTDAMLSDGSLISQLGPFALIKGAGAATTLPREGTASFVLRDHEGYFTSTASGAVLENAVASNASLNIDFAKRTFQTGMTLTGATLQTTVKASGSVGSSGLMASDFMKSDTYIRGTLAGPQGSQAAYLYQKAVTEQINAVGATYWTR
ncbi:FecR domain-containing protein [Zoogloea sp.]|uniref:FecR family protein n=1 Tax=Zoogloea sp. TaxID=49181 RepID=UPI0035B21289